MLLTHAPLSLALRLRWEDAGRSARINGIALGGCLTKNEDAYLAWMNGWEMEDTRIARLAESASVVEPGRGEQAASAAQEDAT